MVTQPQRIVHPEFVNKRNRNLIPYIIALANEKGGVAKTTSTVSLGACLAELGKTVLLIDLDPQANLTLALGLNHTNSLRSMIDFYNNNNGIQGLLLPTEIKGMDAIPACFEMTQLEEIKDENIEMKLGKGIHDSDSNYSYVIMDCPPHIGMLTRSALIAANLLIMPTQAEFFSIYALKTMMNLVKEIRKDLNASITYKLLLTMFDKRNRIHQSLSTELRNTFGSGVFDTVIEIDTKLRESQIAGQSINISSPSSRASLQYRALAQEIENYAKEKSI